MNSASPSTFKLADPSVLASAARMDMNESIEGDVQTSRAAADTAHGRPPGPARRMARRNDGPNANDPEGGIPAGPLEVTWEVRNCFSLFLADDLFGVISRIVSFVSSRVRTG